MQEPTRQRNQQSEIGLGSRDTVIRLFDRFWDDVAPFNNFSPAAARALLAHEAAGAAPQALNGAIELNDLFADPWFAVRAALRERAAGRPILRSA
jgi:hypothetical protein